MGSFENVTKDLTVLEIFKNYANKKDYFSARLGASLIGHHCDRYLWQSFRWCVKSRFDGRMQRLFETGAIEEKRLIENLRKAGVDVRDIDEGTGKQFTFTECNGHFVDKLDGACIGLHEAPKTWHVLETKTHNQKSFDDLEKKGVRESKYQHFAQCQIGMHLTGMERAYYLAVNKNNDDIYAERIYYDEKECIQLIERANSIIFASSIPEKTGNPSNYLCKFCDCYELCHGDMIPLCNCRTCCNSTPIADGQWTCERFRRILSYDNQLQACPSHLFIPTIINAQCEALDNEECVRYNTGRYLFCNCNDIGFPSLKKEGYRFVGTSQQMSGKSMTLLCNDIPF